MKLSSILAALFLISLASLIGCDSGSFHDYKAKTTDEEEIKITLTKYFEAWNNKDADGVLSLIHEDAQMMVGAERSVLSKKQFTDRLPERFKNSPKFKEGSPKMNVMGREATVTIPMKSTIYNLQYVVKLAKENDKWYIMSKIY